MWRKLSICLVVFLLVASSLWCYPAWVYGKTKTVEPVQEVTDPETPEEVLPQETATASEVSEETIPSDTTQEAPETHSTQGSGFSSETLREQGNSLVDSLKGSKTKTTAVEQVSEYIDNAVFGVEVMEIAYNAEVSAHEATEQAYNKLVKAKSVQVTLNPYAMFAPFTQTWGVGINTLYTYKGLGLSIGIEKPTFDFTNYDDLTVTAGLVFTF